MQNSVATLLKRSLKREHKTQLSSGECKGEEHHYHMTKCAHQISSEELLPTACLFFLPASLPMHELLRGKKKSICS